MDNQEQPSLLMSMLHLIQAYLNRLSDIMHLASLEARLALKTLVSLTLLFFFLFILLLSSWLSVMMLLFVTLLSWHYSLIFSAAIITVLNLSLLIIGTLYSLKLKRNLFFPATRKHIYLISVANKDGNHEQPDAAN
jgi:hypothetical protein